MVKPNTKDSNNPTRPTVKGAGGDKTTNNMKKPVVFDNEGATVDRFTIITKEGEIFGASTAPFHPQGIGMYSGNVTDNNEQTVSQYIALARKKPQWLGVEVSDLTTLPAAVQQYINQVTQ